MKHSWPHPESPWARYEPTAEAPWDLRRVVHLHRRAGFAANWAELERDLKEGPEASINRVLTGSSRAGVVEDFESAANLIADAAVASGDVNRLRAWWIFRMLASPDPLAERLTLMWHDHFATAQSKVEDIGLMRHQNETFRRFARALFGDLLNASIREPALLLYLDAPSNRKDHPNENLARELMELFTLGIGNFTEADVKEAARALTGWTVDDGAFRDAPSKHDDGDKTLLGQKGRWAAPDLLSTLLDQPATARRIARRMCGLFMGEGAVDERATTALADELSAPINSTWGMRSRRCCARRLSSRREPSFEGHRAGRVRHRGLPGLGACRVDAEHSSFGRLDDPARAGAVRATQRRRLAGRPGVADPSITCRPCQFHRGPGRRRRYRPAGSARCRLDRRRGRARQVRERGT